MDAPSVERQSNINWNMFFYFGSLTLLLFFAACSILFFFDISIGYDSIFDNLFLTALLLMTAYLHKPIKIPDGMERAEAETFVTRKINRREFFRYAFYALLFAIGGFILIIRFFDLGTLI
jgi:hypothetical protein